MNITYESKNEPYLKKKACIIITKSLPEWFGKPSANRQYAVDAEHYGSIIAFINERPVGCLFIKEANDRHLKETVTDIHWMGVLREYHKQGIGKNLIKILFAQSNKNQTITVETLDPRKKDPYYLRTYEFYKKMGFEEYHFFSYSDGTPMVRMKANLQRI